MATKKVLRVGNSLAVIIPAEIIKSLSLKVGDKVRLIVDTKKSKLTLSFPGARQLPLLDQKIKKTRRQKNSKLKTQNSKPQVKSQN